MTFDVVKYDVMKYDIMKYDVMKYDAMKDDVMKDDVMKDNIMKYDVMKPGDNCAELSHFKLILLDSLLQEGCHDVMHHASCIMHLI